MAHHLKKDQTYSLVFFLNGRFMIQIKELTLIRGAPLVSVRGV